MFAYRSESLATKKMVYRDPRTNTRDVWIVNDLIWKRRDELLELHPGNRDDQRAPWER